VYVIAPLYPKEFHESPIGYISADIVPGYDTNRCHQDRSKNEKGIPGVPSGFQVLRHQEIKIEINAYSLKDDIK
jgi:hypothetical protein